MSPRNWRQCPQCKANDLAEIESAKADVNEKYGKVPLEEYKAIIELAESEIEYTETMREDYDIRISASGEFTIDYGCSCQDCGFTFTFEHHEQVPGWNDKKK